jgi:predicted GNAT family acetyltransferase
LPIGPPIFRGARNAEPAGVGGGYPARMGAELGTRLQFYSDPAEFLAVAGDHLAGDPVIGTVVTTMAHRTITQAAEGIPPRDGDWWLVVRDKADAVCGAGMRTAPFAPYPLFLLPMPDEAAVALARTLHERGEEVLGVNGALPGVNLCAAELARLGGGRVEVAQHTRLHELRVLIPPTPAPGRLVAATDEDVDLAVEWFEAFMGDADEQAGRSRGSSARENPDRTEMLGRIRAGRVWFWVDDEGRRVHMTGANPPSFGVARVGPVYTPPSERGHGWASNAVAEVSRRIQAAGIRPCLFTDQANPTSNKIYTALGYEPVVDMANLSIVR